MTSYLEIDCLSEKRGCRTCRHNHGFEKRSEPVVVWDDDKEYDAWDCACDWFKKPLIITKFSGCYKMYEPKDGDY